MFFRKSEADKRKRKPKAASQQTRAGQPSAKAQPANPQPAKARPPRRRLDAVVVQIRPPAPRPPAPRPPQPVARGAPLAPETWWLLEKMRQLSDIENYRVFKEGFIALYLSNPLHDPASAARAFYSAVQTCRRRLGR
jgi:hypothetical protein